MERKYDDLAESLRSEINAGGFDSPMHPFPTLQQISEAHGVSTKTVQRAIDLLVSEGLLRRATRKKIVVTPPELRATEWTMTGRYAKARAARGLLFATDNAGDLTKTTIDRSWSTARGDIAELLGVTTRTKVLHRTSVTAINGTPVEMTTMHFPRAVVEAVPELDEPEDIKVVALIEGAGWSIERTTNRVIARHPTDDEAETLGLSQASIVFEHVHGTYATDGTPVEAVRNVKSAAGAVLVFDTFEGELP